MAGLDSPKAKFYHSLSTPMNELQDSTVKPMLFPPPRFVIHCP